MQQLQQVMHMSRRWRETHTLHTQKGVALALRPTIFATTPLSQQLFKVRRAEAHWKYHAHYPFGAQHALFIMK